MKRKLLTLATLFVVAFGATAVAAAPAHAVANCNGSANAVCVFTNKDWTGSKYFWSNPSNGCHNIGSPFNDNVNSAKIDSGAGSPTAYLILYRDANCVNTVSTGQNSSTNARLLDCRGTYNFWNRDPDDGSPCYVWPQPENSQVSSFYFHD